jgi:hypothetical protein
MKNRAIAISAVVIALACLVILAANIGLTQLGGKEGNVDSVRLLRELVFPFSFGLLIVLVTWMIINLLRRGTKGRKRGSSGAQVSSPWSFLLLILVIALVAFFFGTDNNPIVQNQEGGDGNITQPSGILPDGSTGTDLVLLGAFLAAMIIVIALLLRYAKWHNLAPPKESKNETADAIGKAIQDITVSSENELNDSIVRTYHSMLELVRKRIDGDETLTPRELASMSIDRFHWPEQDVNELTRLFELARYSDHPLGDKERLTALDCLNGIRTSEKGDDEVV